MKPPDYYGKLCTWMYDLDKPEAPKEALAFFETYIQKAKGPILEPMCGSGRFLLPLLKQGYPIEGLDTSEEMLQACQSKAQTAGIHPILYQQSLCQMDLPQKYDLIFIPSGSFHLLIKESAIQDSLQNMRTHLQPGGKLIMEMELPPREAPPQGIWQGKWKKVSQDSLLLQSHLIQTDPENPTLLHYLLRYELIQKGSLCETEIQELSLRMYSQEELKKHLQKTGFKKIEIQHSFLSSEAQEASDSFIVICEK